MDSYQDSIDVEDHQLHEEPLSQEGPLLYDEPLSQEGPFLHDEPLSQEGTLLHVEPLSQEGTNRLVGEDFFTALFTVLICFKCKQKDTVDIITNVAYGTSEKVTIYCRECGELANMWTTGRINNKDNHSPFIYNVQSVKAAHDNGLNCKSLQSIFRNLACSETYIFSKDYKIPFI